MSFKKFEYQTGYSGLTQADIATFLKRTLTTDEQTLVTSLITEVERSLCQMTNRQFKSGVDYYEEFGSGHSNFDLANVPVSSLTTIEVDGVDVTANYDLAEDYWVMDELYIKFQSPITSADLYTGVKLTYQIRQFWGEDVKLLLKKWISYEFLNSENAGVGVSNFGFSDLNKTFNVSQYQREKEKIISYYTLLRL